MAARSTSCGASRPPPRAAPASLRFFPPACRQRAPAELVRGENRLSLRWQADCSQNLEGAELRIEGLRERGTDALLRIHLADGREIQAVLRGDSPAFTIPAKPSATGILTGYTRLGFDHILSGWDHLLFVFGLLFLVRNRRALLLTVTAFTLGHSLTLTAAALGWVNLPQRPIEAAIALSIFVLALQLARPEENRSRQPWRMAALFGLLHGFGFAGALKEAGLPAGDIPLALLSFNLGIEIGQIAFIAAVLLLEAAAGRIAARWKKSKPVLDRLSLPAAYLIGTLSFYWLLERLAAV